MAGERTVYDIENIEQASRDFQTTTTTLNSLMDNCKQLYNQIDWTSANQVAFANVWSGVNLFLEDIKTALDETGKALNEVAVAYRKSEADQKAKIDSITIPAMGNFGQGDAFK